ncbi:MAG: T9SS type A sorting domain-containing protein [Bacteroidales bacterium]|nr:T9SS type A sorting domain-containing protein [Bacteroidales bacterium]
MKKVFTLVLVMAVAITSFAQVKGLSRKSVKAEPAQTMSFKGFERFNENYAPSTRSIMVTPDITEGSQTFYDWQSNSGPRNFTAVWPDGYAVVAFTQATNQSFTDRGTGLAVYDPAVGEWQFTEARIEDEKTGFGSIARYKENGLVIAAHTANKLGIWVNEDFRNGGEWVKLGYVDNTYEPTHPAVQCSGENLDIIHVIACYFGGSFGTEGQPDYCNEPQLYFRYEGGEWTASNVVLEPLDTNHTHDLGSNSIYFMRYNPETPNTVAFVVNTAWSDGKVVISEDNGQNWTEKVYYQHPNIDGCDSVFLYPRWTCAEYDGDGNIHLVYEWNGSTGAPGSGSYYPAYGGIGYWSEVLPKNELCIGGIGEVGQPFIMDSAYIFRDLYYSEWFWSDALHEPLPEYIGEFEIVDEDGQVLPRDAQEGYWIDLSTRGDHGSYNCGPAAFASMLYDQTSNTICATWSMIAGDEENVGYSSDQALHYLRLFANVSYDGGTTWEGSRALITDFEYSYDEMAYPVIVPYLYSDAGGDYFMVVFEMDLEAGAYVMSSDNNQDAVGDNNFYYAAKVYLDDLYSEEEHTATIAQMISVYPNPAQGSFNVRLTNTSDVVIYNTVGQVVKTYDNVNELNVSLEPGVYFVNAGNQTQKVVVK